MTPSISFDTDSPVDQRPIAGVGLRLLTALLLAVMFALVKLASTRGVNLVEIAIFVGLTVLAGVITHRITTGSWTKGCGC